MTDPSDTLHQQAIEAYNARQPKQAAALLRQAVAHRPDNPHLHISLGLALIESGQPGDALDSLDAALRLAPDMAVAHYQRGRALNALHRLDDAMAAAEEALRLAPGTPEVLNLRGNLWARRGQTDRALADYRSAIDHAPDHEISHYNLGTTLQAEQDFEAALAAYDKALALSPHFVEALSNKGNTLRELGRPAEAQACYEAALALQPDHASVRWNLSLALLQQGQYARGWTLYENRWHADPSMARMPGQRWYGAHLLRGRSLLLFGEQGLGDKIQFYRYLPWLAALGAQVIVQTPAALRTLVQRLPGVVRVIDLDEPLPEVDFHCPLLSLPLAFHTEVRSIPFSHEPYLHADPDKVAEWQTRLEPARGLRVGLVARGNPNNPRDRRRSIALSALIDALPDTLDYVLLHDQPHDDDAEALQRAPWVRKVYGQLHDLDDTAALCQLLDVIISVDTGVAHLSAALGRPTWILLAQAPDWRWLGTTEISAWYGSARLVRQQHAGDWTPVLARVGAALRQLQAEV